MNNWTIGSDPEMFVKRGDTIASAAGVLGCSKDQKLALSARVRLQEDNVLAEFDINPCSSFDEFNASMQEGIDLAKAELAKYGLDVAEGVTSHIYTPEELASFDKSAFVFGCTPDFNALSMRQNASPKSNNPGLRTAGGHIHIGFDQRMRVTRDLQSDAGLLCDYYHSLPSLFMDNDTRRKELYGKAGAIRMKDYGIEYRSLSAFWIAQENLRRFIYDQTAKVVEALGTDRLRQLNSILPLDRLQQIINTNDRRQADSFMARLQVA